MTNKRKGTEIIAAPLVVVSSPERKISPDLEGMHHQNLVGCANTSSSVGSPSIPWESTLEIMNDLVSNYQSTEQDDLRSVSNCLSVVSSLEQTTREKTLSESSRIQSQLRSQIEEAEELYRNENEDLVRHETHLQELEKEFEALQIKQENLLKQKELCKENIAKYEVEASEEIEKIDEVEAKRMSEVPKIKKQISLFANITGIKWNYDNADMLEGNIAISATKEVRNFSFNPTEIDEFDVANKIWDMMEGAYRGPVAC